MMNSAGCGLFLVLVIAVSCGPLSGAWAEEKAGLRAATFDMDVTPPVGSHMAYNTVVNQWELGLRARGLVLLGAGPPIVLCAVDWIGIGNEGHDAFRQALADAAGTSRDRVAVHTLHQHDAPAYDASTEQLLRERDVDLGRYDGSFAREVISRLAKRVSAALDGAQPITHAGLGEAAVEKVASNRRILGPDGKVRAMRFTACADPKLRAEPEGTIDPIVSVVSLWNGDSPVAVLSYYAVHPQSYYRTGIANPDFPGVARFFRQLAVPSALHIHFNGAGGNLGAGKYNDGAHENRLALAERLADGMRRAWVDTKKVPLKPEDVAWDVVAVALPLAPHLSLEKLEARFAEQTDTGDLQTTASQLAWARRCHAGHLIEVSCLSLGRARLLHLPGELFVEYQLAAKAVQPGLFVAMAAYGDYAPGYIGTTAAYGEGGYETSPRASRVAPETEEVLMGAIRELLEPRP